MLLFIFFVNNVFMYKNSRCSEHILSISMLFVLNGVYCTGNSKLRYFSNLTKSTYCVYNMWGEHIVGRHNI